MGAAEVFDLPWPGPGNSEGPVNPEGWLEFGASEISSERDAERWKAALLASFPWPGPGNSEA